MNGLKYYIIYMKSYIFLRKFEISDISTKNKKLNKKRTRAD